MATGVLVSYPASALHESHSAAFKHKKDLCIRHSKSDPTLATLSRTSYLCCQESDLQVWESIENLAIQADAVLTLEDLKLQYNSCFTCGVSWYEDHVSLDCSECGGYAMQRPCLACGGRCNGIWSRNLAASHEHRRAQWEGECLLKSRDANSGKPVKDAL
ncbi:protein pinocchio-like isoform X1 [Ornithodoros turicata]|uniref:protein pinocchio-like isoform X1 n=1 Tax=Ornithodoros turicata TaxID=34597 RepID=UPI003139021C